MRENGAIGHGIGVRAADLAAKEPFKSGLTGEHVLLLVIDIQNIQLPGAVGKFLFPHVQQPPQHGRAKGIEEKNQAGTRRKREIGGIAAMHTQGHAGAAGGSPQRKISARNPCQCGVQFDSDDGAKGILGGQQQSAAHACAEIDKRVRIDRRDGPALPPAHQNSLKDRRRNRVVSRYMPVVPVPGVEMAAGDQPTGAYAKFQIEWVAD